MQDTWLSNKADEIQGYADRHDMKHSFDSVNILYGPLTSGTSPMLSADGTKLITDKNEIVERWSEHFDGELNRPSSINDPAIQRLFQVAINPELDIPPSEDEVAKAIKEMSYRKAPGSDAIHAEVFKSGGPALLIKLTELLKCFWDNKTLPQEFKDAPIVQEKHVQEKGQQAIM